MGRAREDVKCGALPNLANVFQGNRQEGRTDGRFVPASAWNPIFWRRYFILNKKRARPTFLLLFLVLPFNSAVETGLSSLFPSSLPTRNGKVVRSSETFGGFFSPTTREVSAYTLCVLLVREEGGGDRDEGERERCVEKMKAENPVHTLPTC